MANFYDSFVQGQGNALARQGVEQRNALIAQQAQQDQQSTDAKQTLAETEWALQSPDPVAAVKSLPHIAQAWQKHGIDLNNLDPEHARAILTEGRARAASALGVGPPQETFGAAQTVTIPGADGAQPTPALAQIGNQGTVRPIKGAMPYDPEKFGSPQDVTLAGKPAVAQIGNRGTVRPVEGATPYSKPNATDNYDPTSVEDTAQLIYKGQLAPLTGPALRTSWGQSVTKRLAEIDRQAQSGGADAFSGGTFAQKSKALRDFSTGAQGNSVRFMNVAISHINTLQQLGKQMDNGDVQALNKFKNLWRTQSGSPLPTNFNAARDIVANEVVKAVTASGGALADRQEAQAQISSASSWEQLAGIADTWKQLLAGQLGGLRLQYEQSTGMKDFNKKLYPETLKELGDLENPSANGGPAAGSIEGGYRFKGGDPADQKNWEKVGG